MGPSLRLVVAAALMAVCSGALPSGAARPEQPEVEALLQHLDDPYRSNSSIARTAFAARARGYAGTIDVEVAGGRRGQDLFGGVTSSAAVGDAEVLPEGGQLRSEYEATPLSGLLQFRVYF